MIGSLVKRVTKAKVDRRPLFERLIGDSTRQAYGLAYRLTGDRNEAEDLVQETYLRAFRFFDRYDEGLPFTSWLYRIMTNVHIDQVRRKKRIKTVSLESSSPADGGTWELPDEAPNAADHIELTELDEPIQVALLSMTPEFRMAVLLSDVEGLSYEEVAQIMDTSVGTVRSRIHRGRKQLREQLAAKAPQRFGGVSA